MAVTNKEIISAEMAVHGITEKVDTYDGWRRNGRQVQKGAKALFSTSIWKPCKVKVKNGENNEAVNKLLMVKTAFFGLSQTAEIIMEGV